MTCEGRSPRGLEVYTLVVGAAMRLTSCDNVTSPTTPTSAGGAVSPEILSAMHTARQDEYLAETLYEGVLEDFGTVQPFANILFAEQRHSGAVGALFANRGLSIPTSKWTLNDVARFSSLAAACAAGVDAERENIEMYDRLLVLDLPADVRQVFSNNRSASELNHLPAFERCA